MKLSAVVQTIDSRRGEWERDLPDAIVRFATQVSQKVLPAARKAIEEVSKAEAHLQSCISSAESATNTTEYQKLLQVRRSVACHRGASHATA